MTVTTLGSFPGANSKDKSARIPAAISNLNKALLGDLTALAYLRAQAVASATAVGKDAFRRALVIYDAQKPTQSTPAPPPPLPVANLHPPVIIQGPMPPPTSTVTIDGPGAQPAGFQPLIPFDGTTTFPFHPHLPPSTVTLTSMKPNAVPTINVGASVDGGVIQGPPAPESSGPSGTVPAPADFGYVAPSATPAATTTAVTATPAPSNTKILIFLALAAGLYFLVEHNKK